MISPVHVLMLSIQADTTQEAILTCARDSYVVAAYRRVYGSRHLQADCKEPGPAPEPYVW